MRTEPSFSEELGKESFENVFETSFRADDESLPDYLHRYGLSTEPFTDDPHFPFYSGAQRRQILDQVLHLIQFSSNLVVLLGDYGVGKTRMAQAIIDSLDDKDDIGFIEGQVTSDYNNLLADILAQFEVNSEADFQAFCEKDASRSGMLVLIVDNTHHLDDGVIADLISLTNLTDSRLRLVFLAEPHLLNRLENLYLPNTTFSDFLLDKYSLLEAVDYLNFRMEMADYLGPEIFTESRVESWWRQAQGQLSVLHDAAHSYLLESVTQPVRSQRIKSPLPIIHIVSASVLVGALLLGYLYWGNSGSEKTRKIETSIPIAVSSQQSKPEQPSSTSVAQSSMAAVTNSVVNTASEAPIKVADDQRTSPSNVASSRAEVVKQTVVPLVHTSNLSSEPSIKTLKSSVVAVKESKAESSAARSKAIASSKSASAEAAIATEKSKNISLGNGYSENEKTLLSWAGSEYTLQLVGVSSEKAAREFLSEQANKKDLLLFKSTRQGKDWFVVVTGRFESSAKARQALQSLPDSQKKAAPWPREIKVIQQEIKSR